MMIKNLLKIRLTVHLPFRVSFFASHVPSVTYPVKKYSPI